MGKAERGSPKDISNRMKAKGLQKLRWYCQMCQKQCRDQNGFKCHCESEAHQRQMQVFGQNPHKFMDDYSREFEHSFMTLMRTRFGNSRVHFNVVYNELIKDRHHIHMNATVWTTLTGFILYCGKTGKLKVEQTEKGWFLTYIKTNADDLLAGKGKKYEEKSDEQRWNELFKKQEEKIRNAPVQDTMKPEVDKRDGNFTMKLSLPGKGTPSQVSASNRPSNTDLSVPSTEEDEHSETSETEDEADVDAMLQNALGSGTGISGNEQIQPAAPVGARSQQLAPAARPAVEQKKTASIFGDDSSSDDRPSQQTPIPAAGRAIAERSASELERLRLSLAESGPPVVRRDGWAGGWDRRGAGREGQGRPSELTV
ncbi:putative DNA/RNA-binding protein KIN17 [Blattamonas nauphoetae]|uniref:DNA/RNA-binding protein KIN17 n=1 Tax=Blattamonas nauphoetae TaxID=2049346 RepID=A0ABQ9YK69_9EUKA|nr:putative DNA/RNA-binding protein KIN17 [Blattamonas nauphoetae]